MRYILALLACLFFSQAAHANCTAPCTKAQVATDIATNWPDNTTGSITPALLRSTTTDLLNSYLDVNGASSFTCTTHQFLVSIATLSTYTCAQPAFTDISGTASAAQLPNPTASTLGGIESYAAVTHQWINTISTSGVPSSTQPACADVSDATVYCNAARGQLPGIATNTAASSGNIGEYITSNVASPGVSITSTASKDVTTVSLTAGDWQCTGNVWILPAGTITALEVWTNSTANTAPTAPSGGGVVQTGDVSSTHQIGLFAGSQQFLLSGTTTISLGINATFTSTATAYGFVGCRRQH